MPELWTFGGRGRAMKNPSTKVWLIDSGIVAGLTGVAILLLPLVSAWCAALSLHLGRTLFQIHSVAVGDALPHVMIGCFLGLAAAWLIRHRNLFLALLPPVLVCAFYMLYLSFGPYPHSWGQSWHDFVLVFDWLLLVAASFLCARLILRRREPNHAVEPTRALSGARGSP